MVATLTSISLPVELLREVDEAAAETNRSREDLLRAAVRRFVLDEQKWRAIQAVGMERARSLGIRNEDDLTEFLDLLPDQ